MSARQLAFVAAALLVAACSSSSSSSSSPPSASSSAAAPKPSGSAGVLAPAPPTFEGVPQLLVPGASTPLTLLPSKRASLPDTVVTLAASRVVSTSPVEKGISRAAIAAAYLCGGPPLPRLAARAGAAFYSAQAVADVLADPRLGDWLVCGREAARASGWVYDEITTRAARRDGWARAFKAPAGASTAAFAPHFQPARRQTPGLADERCEHLEGDACAMGAIAIARVPPWDAILIGDHRTLAGLGDEKAARWEAGTPAIDDADIRDVDFFLSPGAGPVAGEPWLGFIEFAAALSPPARAALDDLRALGRAEHVMFLAAIDSNHEGPGRLVVTAPTPAAANRVEAALGKLRDAIKAGPRPPRVDSGPPDVVLQNVLERMSVDAVAKATLRTMGSVVRLDGTLVVDPADRVPADDATAAKLARAKAFAVLLEAALQRGPGDAARIPDHDALVALGGPAFAALVEARTGRAPKKTKTSRLVSALGSSIELPFYGPTPNVPQMIEDAFIVSYDGGDAGTLDDVLDSIRGQGFDVRLEWIMPTSVRYRVHKGIELYSLEALSSGRALSIKLNPL